MKIGFFGNANNYPFMLARALRKKEHEILFVVSSTTPLDRPENRYSDVSSPYPHWIRDFGPFEPRDYVLPTSRRRALVRLLRDCDAVILNQNGPALLPLIRRPAVMLLTGSDLEVYADSRIIKSHFDIVHQPLGWFRQVLARHLMSQLIRAQRAGIRSAGSVNYFARGLVSAGDTLLDELGVSDEQRIFFMMTDLDAIAFQPSPNNYPVCIFCPTRLTWKKPIIPGTCELDYKGTDVMIKGLGLFFRRTGIALRIRLVKKGMHVAETMQLVEEENLCEQVTWLSEMSQLDVWDELRQADIVFEQLGKSVVGMAGLDAMAMGRPVIANGRPAIMEPVIGAPSTICQAETADEVCTQLMKLVPDRAERERIGRLSRNYLEKHFSADRAAKICLDRLEQSTTCRSEALAN